MALVLALLVVHPIFVVVHPIFVVVHPIFVIVHPIFVIVHPIFVIDKTSQTSIQAIFAIPKQVKQCETI